MEMAAEPTLPLSLPRGLPVRDPPGMGGKLLPGMRKAMNQRPGHRRNRAQRARVKAIERMTTLLLRSTLLKVLPPLGVLSIPMETMGPRRKNPSHLRLSRLPAAGRWAAEEIRTSQINPIPEARNRTDLTPGAAGTTRRKMCPSGEGAFAGSRKGNSTSTSQPGRARGRRSSLYPSMFGPGAVWMPSRLGSIKSSRKAHLRITDERRVAAE